MQYLNLDRVLELHRSILEQSGGTTGIRDLGALRSTLAQPRQTFAGQERFSSLEEKTAAYGFYIANNHPFVDGNKRTAHASMAVFLRLNGYKISADVDEQEKLMINIVSGEVSLEDLTDWLKGNTKKKS